MTSIFRILHIFLLLAYGLLNCAHASSNTLSIAAFEYKPFVDTNLEGYGYIAEIASAALREAGYEVKYEFVPLKRALLLAKHKEVDGVLGAYYSKDRTEYLRYSNAIGEVNINFLTLAGRGIKSGELRELKNHSVGVILGTSLYSDLRRDGFYVEEGVDNLVNLNKLLAGRVDLIAGTSLWILDQLKRSFSAEIQNKVIVLEPPYQVQSIYFTLSKRKRNAEDIIKRFNRGLETIKLSGELTKILKKHHISP